MTHKTWFRVAVTWNVILLVISLIPAKAFPEISWSDAFSLDKWIHVAVYIMLFGFFGLFTIAKSGNNKFRNVYAFIVLLYCLLTAAYTEILQSVMYVGRYFDVLDLIANIIGVLAGWLGVHLFYKKFISWGLLLSQNSQSD
jgi:glycopeptide antibiotics resistance protein